MKRGIAITLLLLAVAAWTTWQGMQPAGAPQAMLPQWPVVHANNVARIAIKVSPEERVGLEKKDGTWMLMRKKQVPASARDVRRLVDDLSGMRAIRVVSRNRTHDDALQVGDKGVAVALFDRGGNKLLDIVVGKQGSDLLSTYVRLAGAPEVVAVDRALVWQVRRSPSSWQAPPATKGAGKDAS